MISTLRLFAPLAALLVLASCSKSSQPSPAAASSPASTPIAEQPPEKAPAKACDMVTQAEMSSILGSAVVAKSNDHSSGKTECIYTAAVGVSPYVKLSVDWGDAEIAMNAMGLMNQKEPGITSPYDGIGDQAAAVGTALMIRKGEDLVTIVFSGVTDAPGAARRIFDTAKTRM
jgi:hypothetical protein